MQRLVLRSLRCSPARRFPFALLFALMTAAALPADEGAGMGEWPTYRADAQRTAYSAVNLPAGLQCRWQLHPPAARPAPAWVASRDTRMPFDQVCHPVISGGVLLYGSSSEGSLNALDSATGKPRWRYFSEGPIRLAPAVAAGRVYVVSDDGRLSCLRLDDGQVLWSHSPLDVDSRVLGNRALISRWPARGGPVVSGGVVYYAAGIWPSEGIYLCALKADTGEQLWCNDSSGTLTMAQPHPTASARSGVSAEGHLVLCGDLLLVPTGRAVPAAFARATGELLYFHLQQGSPYGGSEITAMGSMWFNRGLFCTADTGARLAVTRMPLAAASPNVLYLADAGTVQAYARDPLWVWRQTTDRLGKAISRQELSPCLWQLPRQRPDIVALAVAGKTLVLGCQDSVDIVDGVVGKVLTSLPVAGKALGLAVIDEGLFVTTDAGMIYCFGAASGTDLAADAIVPADPEPVLPRATSPAAQCARRILESTGLTAGYCLDLGCGPGDLALELARQSQLRVIAVDHRPEQLRLAREQLAEAGLLGSRVMVVQADRAGTCLPDSFAELFVSRECLLGQDPAPAAHVTERLLTPWLGVACFSVTPEVTLLHRGPLAGKPGQWTHLYANSANTNYSGDELIKGPLGVLWFDDLGFTMPSRHGRGTAPLFLDGRLYLEGLNGVICVNAYNGRPLWQIDMPGILSSNDQEHILGVAGTGGTMCMTADGLYIRRQEHCVRLNPITGDTMREFSTPPGADGVCPPWGYLAAAEGRLFGSCADAEHVVKWPFVKGDMTQQLTESRQLFALDPETGSTSWNYDAAHSLRHNAIAIGAGSLYLIDRPQATFDRRWRAADRDIPATEDLDHPPGFIISLDTDNGHERWRTEAGGFGTLLTLSTEHDVLLVSCLPTRFSLRSEAVRRVAALRASDGMLLWDKPLPIMSRPIISGRTLYAEPGAWDLLTGEATGFELRGRSYGCGTLAASKNLLTYRSATLGYTDLTCDLGTENYGAIRPGCWINALPVGGLVLVPDATDRCSCSYVIKSSVALQTYGLRAPQPHPAAGTYPGPIDVRFAAVPVGVDVRVTLDGSVPTQASPRASESVTLSADCVLKAKAFQPGLPPSSCVESHYRFNPHVVPLDDPGWSTYDSPGGQPAHSKWDIKGMVITEVSNHYGPVADWTSPTVNRPGTVRLFTPESLATDGVLTVDMASADNDTFGVVFRAGDAENYGVFAMDAERKWRVLAQRQGALYTVLASNDAGYESHRWYRVEITLAGPRVTVRVDGDVEFSSEAAVGTPGSMFGLYAWGCAGAMFRDMTWVPAVP